MKRSKNGKLENHFKKLSYSFRDADIFARHISQGILEYSQLEPGYFYGELTEVLSKKVIVSTHKMNRIIQQEGPGIEDFTTFLLPGNMVQDFSWRKQRLTGKRIGILKSKMYHFAISMPNFFGTPISLNNNYFNELILKHGYDTSIYKAIQQREAIDINPEDAYEMQQIVIELCNSNSVDYNLLVRKLPLLILKAIENVFEESGKKVSSSRDIIFMNSINYIKKNLDQKISVREICLAVDISERSLRYIFNEKCGLSPNRYIVSMKLNKVRKEIKNAAIDHDIHLIAGKWGFSHSGQFAADYKKLFGELPSETLARKQQ